MHGIYAVIFYFLSYQFLFMKKTNHFLSAFLVIIFFAAAIASSDEKDTEKKVAKTEAEKPAINITATALSKAYQDNEVGADQLYKGTVLIITGTVQSINKDFTDKIYVTLKGDGGEYSLADIQCYFSDDHVNAASSLKKGQRVTVKGLGDGLVMNVIVRGCSLVP